MTYFSQINIPNSSTPETTPETNPTPTPTPTPTPPHPPTLPTRESSILVGTDIIDFSKINKNNVESSGIITIPKDVGFNVNTQIGWRGCYLTLPGYKSEKKNQSALCFHVIIELNGKNSYLKIYKDMCTNLIDDSWIEGAKGGHEYRNTFKKFLPDKMSVEELRCELIQMKKKIEEHCPKIE
tara:strand:+ start:262 stop:807 length:546 start_codon:yes stop_codon:yes gene_type:complete